MSNYTRLLQHLHRAERVLPIETIQAALAHNLANSQPVPTLLAATAISSNLFLNEPFDHHNLQALQVAFRHAIHLKYALVDKSTRPSTSIFGRSTKSQMDNWTLDLVKGLQGGQTVMRLTAASGILLGLEDLAKGKDLELGARGKVEDEVIIALAEAMDLYDSKGMGNLTEWEREFQKHDPRDDTEITLCLVLVCQALPLIPAKKLQTLPLAGISTTLTSCIVSGFRDGKFLRPVEDNLGTDKSNLLSNAIAPLSKLTSLTLALLIDLRVSEGINVAASSLERLRQLCARVEVDIPRTLDPSAAPEWWQNLKALLFSCVMITEAVLSSSLYLPPSSYTPSAVSESVRGLHVTPATLAFHTLQILGHLSHVVHQFGGVTSMGTPSEDGSAGGVFKEMRKTFYLALDILSATASKEEQTRGLLETFVRDHCRTHGSSSADPLRDGESTPSNKLYLSKLSYVLACIEQLVPVLSRDCLMKDAWSIVEPHLYIPLGDSEAVKDLRETYEAAHSVVLALFDTNAKSGGTSELSTFSGRLVPFYTKCLIENSGAGQLSTLQLCMAFNALVRNACLAQEGSDVEGRNEAQVDRAEQYALVWLCISQLLEAQKALETDLGLGPKAKDSVSRVTSTDTTSVALKEERLHRLRLVMIACLSAVPHALLGEFLYEIEHSLELVLPKDADINTRTSRKGKEKERGLESDISDFKKGPEQKEELVQALYLEVTERVGDREKELVMRWWYEHLDLLGRGIGPTNQKLKSRTMSDLLSQRVLGGTATPLARL